MVVLKYLLLLQLMMPRKQHLLNQLFIWRLVIA